jgi:hypothetical protein
MDAIIFKYISKKSEQDNNNSGRPTGRPEFGIVLKRLKKQRNVVIVKMMMIL